MQKQIQQFGRSFFYVREFKKQYDNYWTNASSKYYFTVEHREHQFKYKYAVKGVFWYVVLALAGVAVIVAVICCYCRRKKAEGQKKSEEATEDPVKASLIQKPTQSGSGRWSNSQETT